MLALVKFILPGRNIHEIMTEFEQRKGYQLDVLLLLLGAPAPPTPAKEKNLSKFREAFKPLKPSFGVVVYRS